MPEIKNQFTSGKMNKDLDERLVPNGEYRDAMNIQVSTSEGSEVGTIQNILGNSIVPGQGFIPEGAYCVGSIADEKNDKLYYFVTGSKNYVNNDFSTWSYNQTINTVYGNGSMKVSTFTPVVSGLVAFPYASWSQDVKYPNSSSPSFQLQDGRSYRITYDIGDVEDPNDSVWATEFSYVNFNAKNFLSSSSNWTVGNTVYYYRPHTSSSTVEANKTSYDFTFVQGTVGQANYLGNGGSPNMKVFFELTNKKTDPEWVDGAAPPASSSNSNKHVIANSITVESTDSYIIQYDSKTNTVTPVIVDKTGFLQFSRDRLITGINIIDDMLFWTDNFSEPKKINIIRSIEGTDPSGLIHSNFINTKTSLEVPMKEEHITVIKKQPTHAPKIELVSERPSGATAAGLPWNYSGIMRITSPPNPITEAGVGAANTQNTSSMWVSGSGFNYHYDFSKVTVGGKFDTNIETDLNGDSGFFLKWGFGDIIVFKEFGGTSFNEIPIIPLTDYSVKAKILDSWPTNFTDVLDDVIANGDFTIPNSNGTAPQGWTLAPQWTYLPQTNALKFDQVVVAYNGISSPESSPVWEAGATYRVKFKISDYVSGYLTIAIVTPATSDFGTYTGTSTVAQTGRFPVGGPISASGEYSYDVTLSPFAGTGTSPGSIVAYGWTSVINHVYIHADNATPAKLTLDYLTVEKLGQSNARVRCEVLEINNPPTVPSGFTEMRYAVDRLDKQDKLFEFTFPRIAYRYQYEDGEYSAISPFSQPVFLPGTFDYHPKKAHNLGMVNRITSINISSFNHLIDGVTAIDIIYKDDSSPNLYVIDTVKPQHIGVTKITGQSTAGMNSWAADTYIITDEQIGRAVESNQILRPWDNVPKKALGQEISGNRIIYGNYTQGYSLKLADGDDYYPNLDVIPLSSPVSGVAKPSIKSLREYQIGAVFVDKYGRETPVVSNTTGTIKLGKELSDNQNKLKVEFDDDNPPVDLTHVKFFIKETAGEYYNLAMDRFYDAEDGHLWLSFPSSDRNKLSIDDYLILKKAVEGNILVEDNNKYKVLDIKNEAPEFIKQRKLVTEELTHITSSVAGTAVVDIFGSTMMDAPREGFDTFKLNYKAFSRGSASKIHEIEEDVYVEFLDTLSNQVSKRYEVTSLSTDFIVGNPTPTIDDSIYTFKLLKLLGDDVDFMSDGNKIKDNIAIRIYKYIPKNTAQFDGRFFVKISGDASSSENIVTASQIEVASDPQYRVISSKKVGMIRGDHETRHRHDLTGLKMGVYRDRDSEGNNIEGDHLYNGQVTISGGGSSSTYDCFTKASGSNKALYGGFGPWACYFRNYNTAPGSFYQSSKASGNTTDISQYRFSKLFDDNSSNIEWYHELGWITGGLYLNRNSGNIPHKYMNGATEADAWARTKRADDHGWENTQDRENNAVWYLNGGPRRGTSWTTNTYPNLKWTDATGVAENGNDKGIDIYSTSATWKLAVGGIYHKDVLLTTDQEIDGFFGIGDNNATTGTFNSYYQSNSIKSIVQQLKGGTKIRWKEDPTNQIHTIQTVSEENGVINYYKHGTNDVSAPDYNSNSTYNLWYSDNAKFGKVAAQLSPNFSVQWNIATKNSDGGYTVSWNPAKDTLGPIENGIEISVAAQADGSFTTTPNASGYVPKVYVSSLINNDVNGVLRTITKGMILTKHGSTTYNGTTASSLYKGELLIYKISGTGPYTLWLTGYREPLIFTTSSLGNEHHFYSNLPTLGSTMVFKQPIMNGYSQFSCNRINAQNAMGMPGTGFYDEVTLPNSNGNQNTTDNAPRIMPVLYTLEFVEEIEKEAGLPNNPAIWETEPKIAPLLDIYYEASGYNPLVLTEETKYIALPIGSGVSHNLTNTGIAAGTIINTVGYDPVITFNGYNSGGWYITTITKNFDEEPLVAYITSGQDLNITKPDGSIISVKSTGYSDVTPYATFIPGTNATVRSTKIYISPNLYKDSTYTLNWHNCYAFGNGVESNRIRDSFNSVYISNGAKASATIDQEYIEEHRKNGLIYSGVYNSNSGVNNLNQFIMAEKITKDLSPSYGSIQKLYSRDSDLIALCEDKVLQIFANKDALYNADGNINLVSTNNVLGVAKPFVGDYGISTNPESFASETYRAYFTDRVRGAVIRLSMDGLTAISDHGMKDWFRDNLSLGTTNLLGENCLDSQANWDIPAQTATAYGGNCKVVNGVAILGYYNSNPTTLAAYTSDAGNQPTDSRFGKSAPLRMNNILEIGKTYRLQFDVIKHGGYTANGTEASPFSGTTKSMTINNTPTGLGWQSGGGSFGTVDGEHVDVTWVAARTSFELLQYQVQAANYMYDGVTTQAFVNSLVDPSSPVYNTITTHFFGGTVSIKNLIVEEVKQPLKLIGSYDDRQNEYNITVDSVIPTTVSFKEDVRGWVSFKSFIPENGLSCANDYYTLKDGKLWQHHNPGVHRNTFYGQHTNSSFNALLNSMPSSIKSYHTLEYEGSKSRVEGIKTVTVTGIQHSDGPSEDGKYFFFEEEEMNNLVNDSNWVDTTVTINQYRNNTLVYSGNVRIFDNSSVDSNFPTSPSGGPTKAHGRRDTGSEVGQWQVGDIITTQQLHMPGQTTISLQIVDPLNSTPQDGWFVSNIKTDKKQGSLLEFVEKEGKWFNYIKGVPTDYNSTDYFPDDFDFASFDVQGLGVVASSDTSTDTITITGGVNVSLQVGDCIYAKTTTNSFGFTQLSNNLTKVGIVTSILGNIITLDNLAGSVDNQYCVFIKDQIVNMSGLLGYYANAKFENNSKDKAELFVISSEISESSK
jgi:hypothetical protein